MIDKLTLRHSRLAQVAQLKEILQICSGPPEETTEAMDTQESMGGEVKGESSYVDSQMSQFTKCNEGPSGSLPMKVAKVNMMTTDTQKPESDHMISISHDMQGTSSHHGTLQSSSSGVRLSFGNPEDFLPGLHDTEEETKPVEEDLFDYCFTEPIKGNNTPIKCPSKRQPNFNVQIPKKKYDMRSAKDRTRQGICSNSSTVPSLTECQLCRSLQYKVTHNMHAITHVVLLGFPLDVSDCVAIGDVLALWMVLKRVELVDNCKYITYRPYL